MTTGRAPLFRLGGFESRLNIRSRRCGHVNGFGLEILSLTIGRVGRGSSVGIDCSRIGGNEAVANFGFAIRRGLGDGASGADGLHSISATSVFAIRSLGSGRLKHVTHGPRFVASCGRVIDPADPTKRSRRK